MEKIVFKTKIKGLNLKCKKQDIEFKALIMTSRQIGQMSKLIMDNQEEYVQMTISPEKEELEIEPIISSVILDKIECESSGPGLKVSKFQAARSRLVTIYDYLDSDSVVSVAIEELQGNIGQETEPSLLEEPESQDPDDESRDTSDEQADEPEPADINLKLPPKWGVKCYIKIGQVEGLWRYGYVIKIGNVDDKVEYDNCVDIGTYERCCKYLKEKLDEFIDSQENFKQAKPLKKKIEKAIEDWKFENV